LLIAWGACMALLVALLTFVSILLHNRHENTSQKIDSDTSRSLIDATATTTATAASVLGHSVSPESTSYTLSVFVSTTVYVLFAAMHGFTTLMKEKVIIEYGEPVDIYQISVWLFSYQTAFGILFSPLLYFLQGVTVGVPVGFPLSAYLVNMRDGLGCLVGYQLSQSQFDDFIISADDAPLAAVSIGTRSLSLSSTNIIQQVPNTISIATLLSRNIPHTDSDTDTDSTSTSQLYDMRDSDQCSEYTLVYIFLYVVATVVLIECMGRLLQRTEDSSTVPLSRVLLSTMLLSCMILGVYDILQGQGDGWFNSHFGLLDVAVVTVMFFGVELFSREAEPDIEIKTHVPFSNVVP